jgi:hypothetical protein
MKTKDKFWEEYYYPEINETKHHLDRVEILCICLSGSIVLNIIAIITIVLLLRK